MPRRPRARFGKLRARKARPFGRPRRSEQGVDRVMGSSSLRVPFRTEITQLLPNATVAVTAYQLRCDNIGDRITGISDSYSLWRPLWLRMSSYTTVPRTHTGAGRQGFAYRPTLTTGAPTTFDEMLDCPTYRSGMLYERLTAFLESKELNSTQFKWFHTRDEGTDDLYVAGVIFVGDSSTADASASSHVVTVEGEIEFSVMVDPDINPVAESHQMLPASNGTLPAQEHKKRADAKDTDSIQDSATTGSIAAGGSPRNFGSLKPGLREQPLAIVTSPVPSGDVEELPQESSFAVTRRRILSLGLKTRK